MKQLLLLVLVLLSATLSYSQVDLGRNSSVFLELGGSGGFGSINYEKQFYRKDILTLSWRTGLAVSPIDPNNGTAIVFPVLFNGILGKTSHKLELGIGQGFTITTRGSPFVLGIASVGYRYQNDSNRWFYRITYTPLISYLVDFQVQQWAGISIGYIL